MNSSPNDWQNCFNELAPKLVLYARQLVDKVGDAEDVVQMAFVRWWQRNPGGDRAHVPLLYAAVRTIALDLRRSDTRRTKREIKSDVAILHEDTPHFDPALEDRETTALLEKAVRGLPPEQREVVTLRIWGGLTFAEIATATGETINTAAGRFRYALNNLQRALAPYREDFGTLALGDAAPVAA